MKTTIIVSAATCFVLSLGVGCLTAASAPSGEGTLDENAAPDDITLATQSEALTIPVTEPAELGRAYDSQSQSLLFRSCLEGEAGLGQTAVGELEASNNFSFDEVLDKVTGSLDIGVQLAVVKAGAGASIANQHASTHLAETMHLSWVAATKSDVLLPGSIQVNAVGQRAIDTRQSQLQQQCGDEFIAEVKRGASFIATLKVEYLNETDRRDLQGKLRVNLPGGKVDVDGSLSSVDESKLRRTNLSVLVQQNGGHPERMLGILPDGLMTCSLENREPCLRTFENLIRYARDDFSQQITDRDLQTVLGYSTKRYADSQADALVPLAGYTLVNVAVTNKLRQIERLLRAAMADELRVDHLLGNVGFQLTLAQRQRLREIGAMAAENVLTYADISRFCYAEMDESCLSYARMRQGDPLAQDEAERRGDVLEYDPEELEIEVPDAEGPDGSDPDQPTCPDCVGADGRCLPPSIWYRDTDGDGFGDPSSGVAACSAPEGYIAGPPSDCCDVDASAHPGQAQGFVEPNACGSWDYDCNSATSYSLSCTSAIDCGCVGRGTCDVSACGGEQRVVIRTGELHPTYGCSRPDISTCRERTERQVLACR